MNKIPYLSSSVDKPTDQSVFRSEQVCIIMVATNPGLHATPVRFFCYRNLFDAREPRIVQKISPTNQNNKSYSEFTPLKTDTMEPKQSRPLAKGTTSTNHQFFGFHVSFAGHLFSKRVTVFGTSIAQCISITPSSVAFGNPDFGARKGLRCFKATGKCGVLRAGLHYWKATCSFHLV